MLQTIFRIVLALSVAGSLITVLLFLLLPITQRVFNQTWRYRMCILAVMFFLLPVGVAGNSLYDALPHQSAQQDRPHAAVTAVLGTIAPLPITDNVVIDTPAQTSALTPGMDKAISLNIVLPFLPYIWLIGAALSVCTNGFRYIRFRRKLIRTGLPVEDKKIYSLLEAGKTTQGVSGKIRLLTSDTVKTPMLTGIFRTLLVLPEVEVNERELSTIFKHELIHYQRRDLWVKTFMLLIGAIHWFNPVIYLLTKEVETSCELSCDEQVVRDMSVEDRHFYGETILNMLGRVAEKQAGVYATLAETKKGIERRLTLMLRFKKMSKKTAVFSVVIAMLCTLAGCIGAASVSDVAGSASSEIEDIPSATKTSLLTQSDISDLDTAGTSPTAGADVIGDRPSLPVVASLNNEDISIGARDTIESFWDIDLSNMEKTTDADSGTDRDDILASFLSEPEGLVYGAYIDKKTKQIVALDSLSKKSDVPASASLQEEYITAASAILSDKFGVKSPGEARCYLPLRTGVKGGDVDRTVYVFFPDLALHVELSLADYHPIGYRFFNDKESMEAFIKLHTKPLSE